jgi:hypothetical protein
MTITAEWLGGDGGDTADPRRVKGGWTYSLRFNDDVTNKTHVETFVRPAPDNAQVKKDAQRVAANFEERKAHTVNIALGDTIDVTPDPVIPPTDPTQAELDKRAWFDGYRSLQQMLEVTSENHGIPALLTPAKAASIAAIRSSLEAGWLNSYLGDI